MKLLGLYRRVGLVRLRGKRDTEGVELVFAASLTCRASARRRDQWRSELHAPRRMWALAPTRQTERGLSSKGLIVSARQLDAALPLLGKFQPLMRQLFVAPLAFLVPAVRERSVLDRMHAGLLHPRLTPDRAITGCGEIHRHGDLHLPLILCSLVRSMRWHRDRHHKNALFTVGLGCPIFNSRCAGADDIILAL